MFLLRRLKAQEIVTISKFRWRSFSFKTFAWSAFSSDCYPILTKKLTNNSFQRLVCCKYSKIIDELKQLPHESHSTQSNAEQESGNNSEAIFAEIANNDRHILKKLKLLEFEIEVFRQNGELMPRDIKKKHWECLLTLSSISTRKKYLIFLFKNEKKKEHKLKKKMLIKEKFQKLKDEGLGTDIMEYNLSNQCILQRVFDRSLNFYLNYRNHASEEIAQQIIFDCSYQEYMSDRNSRLCALQLRQSLFVQMTHFYPSLVSIYNLKKTDNLYKVLPSYIFNAHEDNFTWPIYEESYLKFYPKDKLVYLTPHCNEPLLHINPGDIFIIGAFVDKGCGVKASLAEAKKNKLRMARLPLDEHVKWKRGQKSLPLNIVLNILLDVKYYRNWLVALKNLPSRQYDEFYENKDIIL